MFVSYVKYIDLKNHLCVDDEVGGKGCHDQHIEGEVEEPEVHQPEQYLDTVGISDKADGNGKYMYKANTKSCTEDKSQHFNQLITCSQILVQGGVDWRHYSPGHEGAQQRFQNLE